VQLLDIAARTILDDESDSVGTGTVAVGAARACFWAIFGRGLGRHTVYEYPRQSQGCCMWSGL
jgi:hypothetical protein